MLFGLITGLFLFFIVCGIIIFFCVLIELNSRKEGIISALAVALLIYGVFWYQNLNTKNCQVNADYKVSLYSGSNGNEINGYHSLMGGRIGEVDMVYYWVKSGNTLNKYSSEMYKSSFIEDGENYLLVKKFSCTNDVFFTDNYNSTTYEFHVPVGSVDNMYSFK